MLEKIKRSKFGDHNLILSKDYVKQSNIHLEYCNTALESLNEMVLLSPENGSINNLFLGLKNTGLDVQKYRLEGSLIIVESKKGYFSLTNKLVDLTIMIKMLLQRPNRISRSGLTIFSDMGLLFQDNRTDDLIKHETGLFLSLSSLKYCNRMKIFCCYDLKDFEFLAEYLKQMLIDNHKEITE